MDYHHLQEIKEARPIKSKIVSEQWRTGKGKREKAASLLLLFPLPILPRALSFSPLPSLLTTPKGFWELKVKTEVPQGKINRGTGTVRS